MFISNDPTDCNPNIIKNIFSWPAIAGNRSYLQAPADFGPARASLISTLLYYSENYEKIVSVSTTPSSRFVGEGVV